MPHDAGSTGARCQGRVVPLTLEQTVSDSLRQGAWAYFQLDLPDSGKWKKVRRYHVTERDISHSGQYDLSSLFIGNFRV